jgi:hypothetical protein
MNEKCFAPLGVPDGNSKFRTFTNLFLETLSLEGRHRLLNTVFLGDKWNWRAFVSGDFLALAVLETFLVWPLLDTSYPGHKGVLELTL